jgi:hypothetical protein
MMLLTNIMISFNKKFGEEQSAFLYIMTIPYVTGSTEKPLCFCGNVFISPLPSNERTSGFTAPAPGVMSQYLYDS